MLGYFSSQDEAYEYAFDNSLTGVTVEKGDGRPDTGFGDGSVMGGSALFRPRERASCTPEREDR